MKEWINVKERLPDNFTDVLAINASGFMHVVHFSMLNFLYKPNRGFESEMAKGHKAITHWMPLPEPPKE